MFSPRSVGVLRQLHESFGVKFLPLVYPPLTFPVATLPQGLCGGLLLILTPCVVGLLSFRYATPPT